MYEGKTTGTPICLLIKNTDQRSKDYGNILDTFRPGHADYTYLHKYGLRDPRGGGRSSARLTAPMVAAGAVAKKWLFEQYGTTFRGCMAQIGEAVIPFESWEHVPHNPFFAPVADVSSARKLHGRAAQGGRLVRRAHPRGGLRRAGRPGRAAVRQARCRHRLCHDGHQRGQGRGDWRRLCRA